jgi:hypothetical protein
MPARSSALVAGQLGRKNNENKEKLREKCALNLTLCPPKKGVSILARSQDNGAQLRTFHYAFGQGLIVQTVF